MAAIQASGHISSAVCCKTSVMHDVELAMVKLAGQTLNRNGKLLISQSH